MSGKYIQELLDHAKQFAIDALKTVSKGAIQKTKKQQKQLVIWLVIKLRIKLRKSLKISPQNSLETVKKMSLIKKYLKKIYIAREDRKKIIDDLSL